ncbi:hypothetical protein SynA1840_00533 [Synechococcus sp. A18-40]|nr:hypothetical protein SynA1840_00533 [Synechococcus sp. A18-40]
MVSALKTEFQTTNLPVAPNQSSELTSDSAVRHRRRDP